VCLGRQVDVAWTEGLWSASVIVCERGSGRTNHLDFPQRVVAVIVQVVRLPVVDAHDTKKQLAVQSQCQWPACSALGPDDDLDVFIDLVLQHLSFCELLVLIGGEPDTGQLAGFEQKVLGKKHGGGGCK
jgi:hypothetical protein